MTQRMAKPKPNPQPKQTYDWTIAPVGGTVICYISSLDTCTVAKFVEATTTSPFHGEDLQRCTKELNAVINKYSSKKKDANQRLSFLKTSKGLFLAWTVCEATSLEDDDDKVLQSLGISTK